MSKRNFIFAAAISSTLFAGYADAQSVFRSNSDFITDQLIVHYKSTATFSSPSKTSVRERLQNVTGMAFGLHRVTSDNYSIVRASKHFTKGQFDSIKAQLQAEDPDIESVEPDLIAQPALSNDTNASNQWNLYDATAGIDVSPVWAGNAGVIWNSMMRPEGILGQNVTVAVVDTGYRPHVDLAANIVPGYDLIGNVFSANDGDGRDGNAQDPGNYYYNTGECQNYNSSSNSVWHGTHVAGIIAAIANNGIGISGVAPRAKILPVRVAGRCGAYSSDIADGIAWAAGQAVSGAPTNPYKSRVINVSLGMAQPSGCDSYTQSRINQAVSAGAIVVVSAGNQNGISSNYYPNSCQNIISVAATNKDGAKASYSNYGSNVALSAPGGEVSTYGSIWSTYNTGLTAPVADSINGLAGTSMAAPHVAGVIALMLSKNPTLSFGQVLSYLRGGARPVPVYCNGCGAGIVDAYKTLQLVPSPYVSNPLPPGGGQGG